MCGIAGYIATKSSDDLRKIIQRMTDSVAHRGPDGGGIFIKDNLALGHRRLAIIDLSELGHQPMIDPDSGFVIVYNGEIYNYLEIRADLISRGCIFRSRSDTEVILKAYETWGVDCVRRFNGMWAFAIYDCVKKLIFCSRDRFGVKPFYFAEADDGFAFGSEIRQMLPLLNRIAADAGTVSGFLLSRTAERKAATFFYGVRKLPAGHNLVYDLTSGVYRIDRFYWLEQRSDLASIPLEDAVERFRVLLADAISIRLRSDVRVGTCLSGGLDSSSIATLAARNYTSESGIPFSAITAISEDPSTDESRFAGLVVERSRLDWMTVRPSYEDFLEGLHDTVKAQEEPFAGASVIMQYFVMQAARRAGIPVMLDGQGGDETLLGYERYFADYFVQLLKAGSVSGCVDLLRGLLANGRKGALKSLAWNLLYFHTGRICELPNRSHRRLLRLEYLPLATNDAAAREKYAGLFELQRLEVEANNLPVLLRYEDKNSMWHSIETRLPFLDYRVVEFALSLCAAAKLREGWTKYVLRKSMESEMPVEVAWRRDKFGFEAPESRWMRSHATVAKGAIQASELLRELCRENALSSEMIDGMRAGIRWRLFSLALWSREFRVASLV